MLVKITNVCDMGCSHCMEDALPEGGHMLMDTYHHVLDFILWAGFPVIMLSGGEPTQHPDILSMIKTALDRNIKPFILSNGTFLEKPELKDAILKMPITVQVTNDSRFYPKKVPIIKHPLISYEHNLRVVSPFGRAVKNSIKTNRISPLCFNLRSICRTLRNLKEALLTLRSTGRMCTPSINIDGSVIAGESRFCSVIGTVFGDKEELLENICSLRCNKCGLVDNLNTVQRNAVGE